MRDRPSIQSDSGPAKSKLSFGSVIVVCHDRRQYLLKAVESVLAQTVDRTRFEIIVVKNYKEQDIDATLARVHVRSIICEAKPATLKAVEGVRISRGNVLLFLDDDDLYKPNRLEVLLEAFDQRPDLGFYRNEVTFIGADGAPLSRDQARTFGIHASSRSPRIYLDGHERYSDTLRLARASPEFNPSTMAIRRELFDRGIPYLVRMTTTLDTLLWFEGLVSDHSILLDNRPLTCYRIHNLNSSLARGKSRKERVANMLESSRSHDRDYRIVREFVCSTGQKPALRQIDASILVNRLTMLLRDPFSSRRDILRLYLEVMHFCDTAPIWRAIGEFGSSLLYLLAPNSARSMHERHIGVG